MLTTTLLLLTSTAGAAILWSLFFIFFIPLGLQLYKISEQNKVCMLMKKLPKRSTIQEGENIRGWIWGYPYIGYINPVQQNNNFSTVIVYEVYIFTTKKFFNSITKSEVDKAETDKNNNIELYERMGSYCYFHYDKRELSVDYFTPRLNQIEPIETIKTKYSESIKSNRPHLSVIIHGNPGAGKSMIPILLAKEWKASLCDTFNPSDPGDSLSRIYNTVCPTEENPLIVVLEEFDILIKRIHSVIKPHKNIPINVYDKTTWNSFFDRIDRHMYPFLIIILTSNVHPDVINQLDTSYIRPGRTDLIIELK